jgi:hypothetical protein
MTVVPIAGMEGAEIVEVVETKKVEEEEDTGPETMVEGPALPADHKFN